jgi:hypothetical protein
VKALLLVALSLPCYSKVLTVTNVAAVTTITVNALEIKTTIAKARAAAKATKKTVVNAAKKLRGK